MRSLQCVLLLVGLAFGVSPILADTEWPTFGWQLATPNSVGLDRTTLRTLNTDLKNRKYGYVDSILVIRHGKVAYEKYYDHDYSSIYGEESRTPGPLVIGDPSGPYNYFNAWWHPYHRKGQLHTMQSVTKTIVSAVIGIAIKRGDFPDLDTPVLSFFDIDRVANIDEQKSRMTLYHLLTMSTGLDWNEDLPYTDPSNTFTIMALTPDWVRYTLDRPMRTEPGKEFRYNSGATLILGHIFRLATGTDIEEYVNRHLFQALGIDDYQWKRTPFGLADTQEGLYISTRDIAKFAYLFLRRGKWEGKQVVPAEWIDASFSPAVSAVADGSVDYGYKWWLQHYSYRDVDYIAYLGKGFGGQRPIILPDFDIVIIFTGWNILPNRPFLTELEAIRRVLEAIKH